MAEFAQNVRIGPFTILQVLPSGRGGMARVYLARMDRHAGNTNDSQLIALKLVLTESERTSASKTYTYTEALNNEVELLKRLRHPNIVKLFPIPWGTRNNPYLARAAELDGKPWYCAMEYLPDGSLHRHIQEYGQLKLEDAVEIAYQISLALDFIHSKDIAHLDVKPDNVLFRIGLGKDHPIESVLIDFGIATRRYKSAIDAGAMPYLAPERLRIVRGETPPENVGDQRPTDVYSLGILLYRMLTARMPFQAENKDHLTSAILYDSPTRPSSFNRAIPPPVEELILAALEKDPRARPTANEFTEALEEAVPPPRWWLSGTGEPPPLPPKRKSVQWFQLGTVLALIVIGFGTGFFAANAFGAQRVETTPDPKRVARTVTMQAPTAQPVKAAPIPPDATKSNSNVETSLPPTATLVPTRPPTPTRVPTQVPSPTISVAPTEENPNGTLTPAPAP